MSDALIKHLRTREAGAATLLVTIMLLIGITLIALFATRVGVLDQKISGNEYRHKEAFSNAEAGLEQAVSYIQANSELQDTSASGWSSCSGLTSQFPCDIDGAEFVYADIGSGKIVSSVQNLSTTVLPNSESFLVKRGDNIVAVGRGTTADATGFATAIIDLSEVSLLTPGAVPPLMAPEIDLSGNFTIVPNPNGGGPGVPLSAWAGSGITTGGFGSWQTCNHGEFLDGGSLGDDVCIDSLDDSVTWKSCGCLAGEELSDSGPPAKLNNDLLYDDPGFPGSPFNYFFNGLSKLTVKDSFEKDGIVLDDCSTLNNSLLNSLNKPLVWINNDCNLPTIVGSRDKPIILVVEGEAKASGNADLWGVLLGLGQITLNGTTTIHGSVISEEPSKLTTGGYSQVYDDSVLSTLKTDSIDTLFAKVKYSWRDF